MVKKITQQIPEKKIKSVDELLQDSDVKKKALQKIIRKINYTQKPK